MIVPFLENLEWFFGWLLAASWQASVLAVFVLLIQRAFGSRLNPRWRYALWLLVLLRLVLPVLPESALSLFQFAPPPPVALTVTVTEPLFISAPSLPLPDVHMEVPEPTHPFSAYSLLAVIWLVGAMILLVLTWQVNRRFGRQVADSPAISDPELLKLFTEAKAELGVRRTIRLIENGQVQSPAIMGLFQPTLLLPADVREKFDSRELRFIFLHELAHLKRGDVIVQGLIALLQILHWFNPVLWFAFRRMRIDREPATDALVLSRTGEAEKEHYGLMLIKLLEHFNQRHSLPTLVGILEDKDQFKRRFTLIARFTRGAYGWSLLGVLLIGILSIMCLTKSKATESQATVQDPTAPTNDTEAMRRGIAAVVNHKPIFWSDIANDPVQSASYQKAKNTRDETQMEYVVQEAIDHELVLQEAEDSGYRVPQSDLDERLNYGVKGFGGNKEDFVRNLEKNGSSLENFMEQNRRSEIYDHMFLLRVMTPAEAYLHDHPPSLSGASPEEIKKAEDALFQVESTKLENDWMHSLRAKAVIQTFEETPEQPGSTALPVKADTETTMAPTSVAENTSQQAQTYLEVTYIKTTDTSAMPGGLAIDGDYAKKLIQNPKNKVTKLVDFPLTAGTNTTNTIKGKIPWGSNFTVTLNWSNSPANKADLSLKMEWPNANGGNVSYGAQYTAKLGPNECYLVRGPWKTRETSNLLIGFVDHPSGQPQKADSGANTTDPNMKTVQEKYASQLDNVSPDQKETAAKAFAAADAFLSAIDSGGNVPAPRTFDGTMPTDESWPAYLDGVRARFGQVQARHPGAVDSVSQPGGIYELSVGYETTFQKGNVTSTALELVRVARTPPSDPKGEWKVTEFNICEKDPTGQWSSPVTILSPDADARAETYFNQTLQRDRMSVADSRVKSSTLAADAQMLEAIQKGDVDSLKKVLEHAVDPNTFDPDRFHSCPVYWAVHFNQPEILKLLLDHMARDYDGPAGETPLQLAKRIHPDLVPILEEGAKRNRALLTAQLTAKLHSTHIDLPAFSNAPLQQVVSFLIKAMSTTGYLERRVGVGNMDVPFSTTITSPAATNISIWDALQTIADANKLKFDVDEGHITFYPPKDEATLHPPTEKAEASTQSTPSR